MGLTRQGQHVVNGREIWFEEKHTDLCNRCELNPRVTTIPDISEDELSELCRTSPCTGGTYISVVFEATRRLLGERS